MWTKRPVALWEWVLVVGGLLLVIAAGVRSVGTASWVSIGAVTLGVIAAVFIMGRFEARRRAPRSQPDD